jgi:hypothetical protein
VHTSSQLTSRQVLGRIQSSQRREGCVGSVLFVGNSIPLTPPSRTPSIARPFPSAQTTPSAPQPRTLGHDSGHVFDACRWRPGLPSDFHRLAAQRAAPNQGIEAADGVDGTAEYAMIRFLLLMRGTSLRGEWPQTHARSHPFRGKGMLGKAQFSSA